MKITFEKKKTDKDHLVIVYKNALNFSKSLPLNAEQKQIVKNATSATVKKKEFIETIHYSSQNKIKSLTLAKLDFQNSKFEKWEFEAFGGKLLTYIEKNKINNIALIFEDDEYDVYETELIINGLNLKSYKFEKYKTNISKNSHLKSVKIIDNSKSFNNLLKQKITSGNRSKGVFLTRDLVSEPANVLYPSKFVDFCNVMKKSGVSIEVLDENKMKSLKMNALLGVSQGSVRPARTMIMRWNGSSNKKKQPIAFIGKGVTFDTGGISIKPSGGMEDMKWDMGGAGVVAGLMYTLALRKAKTNVIGAVGLVENMPDGNAQRPGDIVKSMSGQTIEVLNTDAEGRLVLADVLWYVKERFKPKLMIDLATLTGAIIVALGDRYAGMFTNSDEIAEKLYNSSKETQELVWRLPLDNEFDKLLNCQVADMKNITGTRGAGSITAAQFIKRFIGQVDWAHLDIAGVTWSKKGTHFSRPGGTGFGVRLLDNFVKRNYG